MIKSRQQDCGVGAAEGAVVEVNSWIKLPDHGSQIKQGSSGYLAVHLAGFALATICFVQAFAGTRGAAAAVAGDAEFAAQIFQGARAAFSRLANLAVGYRLADTDVHDDQSFRKVVR